MATISRQATSYAGVTYRIAKRIGGAGTERVYYIRFKKDGKEFEEKVGRQYADNMTPAKASGIRAERIEGKRESRKTIKEKVKAEKFAELNKATFAFIFKKYEEQYSTKKSLSRDKYTFKNHLADFSPKTPDEISTTNIVELKQQLEKKKLAPATIKQVLTLLRLLVRFAVRNEICDSNAIAKLHFEMPKVDNQKTEMLSAKQLVALEEALKQEIDQNAANFIRLALATGMRKTALMNLRWDDVDFYKGFITLRGDVAKKAKTERIPLSQTARAILQATQKIGNSEYVFPGKDGGPRREFRRVANRVKKKAGLPSDFRPLHGLRHAYASLLASSGKVDLYTLQKLLTHSSPTMTQRYAHLADEAMFRAASVVDDIFKEDEKDEER